MNIKWFNISVPVIRIYKYNIRLFTLFNCRSKDGHFWGLSILQISERHLFVKTYDRVGILWLKPKIQFPITEKGGAK